MWQITISLCLGIVGLIHIIPVTGVMGCNQLQTLYGVQIASPDLLLLMRHRAVLFFIVGVLLLSSIRYPQLQWAAILAALLSVASFLVLAVSPSHYTPEIAKVFYVDVAALALLLVAAVARWRIDT